MHLESLESRRLLSTVQALGTFTGTEEHLIDGTEVSETINIAALAGKKKGTTNIELTIHDNLKSLSYVLEETFAPISAASSSDLIATIPSSIGSGTITVNADTTMSISATLDTGIFAPLAFTFIGTRVASAAKSADAFALSTTTTTSPDVGLFLGHMTASPSGVEYTTKTNIRINSKGHPALDLLLSDPSFDCAIEIASAIHPTHTGAFTLDLGTESSDGILTGHITHTGRLVLDLNVAGFSTLSGSQKRHG